MFLLALVLAVLFVLVVPVSAAEPPRPLVVGHRGLLHHTPENTLAGFRSCLAMRIGFEFDVQKSSDGSLVCIHDEDLKRTTDGAGKVSERTLADLRRLDAGRWFDPKFAGEPIPTVDEILKLVAEHKQHDVLIAVDLKADGVAADVVRLAETHAVLPRLLFIGTTIEQPAVRDALKRASRKAQAAVVANKPEEFVAALGAGNADWVYFRYVPSADEMAKVRAAGRKAFLAGKTVAGKEIENWKSAARVGVDGILTDYAVELTATLRKKE